MSSVMGLLVITVSSSTTSSSEYSISCGQRQGQKNMQCQYNYISVAHLGEVVGTYNCIL